MKNEKYYLDKLLKMGEEFQEAYRKKEWFRAKYLYDTASTIAVFLEAPQEVRGKLWGYYNEERDAKEQGLFDDSMRNKVMKECILADRLGFECVVYRIPGEVGYFGAKKKKGTRHMAAEENPAFYAK